MSDICLRCGGNLPDGCSLTRKFCDDCAKERRKELRRERERIARESMAALQQERIDAADRAYCQKCIYSGRKEYSVNLCDYILDTGHRRGCKAGVGCEKRILKEDKDENHA